MDFRASKTKIVQDFSRTNHNSNPNATVEIRQITALQNLGEVLRLARRSRGLTQTDLARMIGVNSGQLISDWERGYGPRPPVAQLKKVISCLGLPERLVRDAYVRRELSRLETELLQDWTAAEGPAKAQS